ncbi:MAG: hypothetical protein ACKVP0_12950 [Pirellulaceae bacterium]
MHIRITVLACLAIFFTAAHLGAQDSTARTDIAGLKKVLVELGYSPEEKKSGESAYLQIELKHSNEETRKHLVGIDPGADTVYILGGGFSWAPDPKKASNEWFRKLLKHNHKISPSYIFLNDFDVFGLTTVTGNVGINGERLKAKLKQHVTDFDEKLLPLVKELPGKEAEDNK